MSKGFQDAVWNGLDTRRYDLENMPEYTPPEDVGYIKSIGQNVLSGIESTLGGAGMFIGANMASGSPDYSKGGMMGKASNVGRDFGAGLMNESQYLLNDAGERQANYGASAMDWGGLGDAITNPDYWLSPRGLTADVAQGIGSSLPTLVAGGIGGKVASPLLSAIASGIGRQALKEGAASAAGKALSYMGGFGVGGGASEAISDAGSNYNDILQNLQGKVNPDGTPMYDEQGAITEATRRMNDLGLSEMPYLMASNALTGGMVAGKMSKLLGQDSKSIGRRALANVFGAGADMTGEGFTEVAQTTLANDAMDKPSGNMWNPREWDEAQSDSFRGGFMGALLPAAGGGAYNTVFGDIDTSDGVEQIAPQVNNNLFGAGTAEISTQGADIDEQVAHLKDGYQSVIPQVAGVLVNDFGIEGAQISSAFRTREHNKEVGGVENSYHVGDGKHGDALDIVLPDGTSAETAETIKQRFENSGVFDEVLFHDAGSGYHLHLGGLKTDNIGNSYGSYSGDADVDSAINEMAEKYNLDPALLAAMAEQESGFNQSAQSEAGAMGIMQLMPGTAEGLGVDPSDLRGNLEGGAKYLRQMLDKYNGDVEKALAAYNAGPGSLDSVNGDISKLSGETQKYVPSVMERYNKLKNKSGGGISSSGNILDWDSTNEDFSKLDFFPKDGEQSQGTANEFLENLAKLEESDDKATKEKGRQAQDILQQYGDDTEKLTEKAKELGYQQTVNPAEVHGRIPMRRIVSTALNNGQVTFATKKAADIFASSPIGQTMERQGKTFKVTDNFKMNEQVNAISQQVYSDTKTVKNCVMADAAAANRELNGQARPPIQQNDSVLTNEDRGRLISVMPNLPPQVQQQIQEALAENDIKAVRQLLDEATNSTPLNAETDIEKAKAITRALLQNPEATTSWDGNGAVRTAAIEGFINSNNLDGLNRANKYMAQNLRDKGINPLEVLNQNIEKPNTLSAVQGERMPSTDVQREEPAIEGTVADTVITPPYNGKPAYNENQLEAPAIESDHLNSEDFLAGLSPVERGFMEYLDKMFDNLQLGFNDVLEYLRARQKDIFNKRMESVIQQGPQGLTSAFYTNGGKMVVDNDMPQEVQNAWNQLLSMRKNFGASLANSTAEIQNEYMRVESVVKDYLTTTVTEQCKNNVSWRKLNYAITGLEAIADKARRCERSVSEEGKRGSTKSYRDVSAEEGQAIEDSAVAWSGAIHQYGTTETRLRSFLNTLGSNFTKKNHGMALRAKTKYKGQPMNKAGRVEALIRDGGRIEERGKEYFAVDSNGGEVKVTKGEHNYYKWLRQNGFAQQERAPEGAPQLAENNGVTEDNYRARQPEYNGKESHEKDVKKEESTKGQTKPQNNDNENPNASNEPMRKEFIEQAAANEDTWVNSKKSELHLEDDNDTVVKLTPQELKYYQDLVRKGVVAKPELYEESQEDVGEMDDNVEMSKEQKQLYDESSDDRDMPSVEEEAEPTAGEPRTKYSREKSPVDEKKPTHHNVECRDVKEQAKRYVQSRLDNGALKTLKPSDDVNTAIEKIIAPIKREVDNQAARYLEAGHEPEYYQARLNMINYYKQLVDEIRRDFNAGDRQSDVYGRVINDTWFRQSAGEGSNLRKSVQKRNAEIETREDENSGVNSSSAKTGKTYENYNPKTQKVLDMMYKHSSRDKSAFSIEPINPHSAESLKENGNSNTELDRLPKVPIAKLRQSEQKIVRFGKAIGVPVHFVESSDKTNRGVFTHNGEIFINRKAKVPAHSIFVHEFVHWLKASPENAGAYDVLHACLENYSGLFNEARINKYRNKIFDGEKMTDEEIVEEIICDAMTQTESAEKLMRAVNNVDGGLVTRIAGCLKAMWDKFCEYMNFKQHKMSNEQHLPNELSVAEFQRADIAFNKILMNLKNDNGEPVFHRVGTELLLRDTNAKPIDTYQIKPISYTYAPTYSKENKDKEPIDRNNNQQDNVIIEFAGDKREAQQVFNKHLTQGLKDLTRQTIEKEITDNIKDFEKLADPVELDKAMNDLPAMKRMRQWFQQKDMQSKPAYMDRLAARYEYARRCFLNDSRIRDRFIRPAGRYNQQERISETISSGISRVKRTGQEGSLQQSDGRGTVAPTVGEYKFIKNHFDKLIDKLANGVPKHSKESAFLMPENGKPYTMSYYHNIQPSPKMAGDMFAQSIEPSGEYIAHDTMNGSNQIPGFEYGKISFKSPLVLEHKSTGHGGWKTDLSNMFEGKKGKALSNAIKKAGHDGIITIDSKTGEILETVNLAGTKNNGNKYSRGVDLSPSTDGVAIAARANNNLVANMKGIVKKANAKFNPFHHEELENLRIDKRDEKKDLNLIEYQFVSPTRESKKYKVIQPFVMKGKQAMAKQEKLRFEFNEGMNEIDKLLGWREGFHRNDSKFKERKDALNEILLKGDLEGKEFTNDELIKAGYDAETIKGYRKMRALLDKAWKLANDTKSRIKYQSITSSTLRRAEADFADLKDKNPFAEIISKVHNPDGTVTINYKAPHVRRVAKQTVLPSELENLRKNKDVHIVETTQSLKGTTQVTYYQREAGMGKLKGYIPHVFHGWYVCKVDKDGKAIVDEDGNVAMDNIVTTANSLSEAAKLGRELAKENPNANYRVVPQTFSAPGAQEQAIVMGDFDYAKIVGKVADSMSMSITDAQAMLDNTVKMKNRGRFYGYAKQRKGFKGFEQNVYLATMKYFNQTARYAAMDSFKRDSISMYNRIFGAFDDENVTKRSAMAKWTKQYISDMNGTPTWIEKMINNTLHNFGLGEERAGGRPALWLQQKIFTYPMTILKLGVFNPSSALLNLTQLFNLYGAMGEKVLSPQAYQRLLHKGFADTFRAMSNKDSELGKLLWKELGLDYQIGMDIASGYSNAEVSNLASLRGFASRLAGKSMYLFRQSDAFARGVTLLTAYNKALDEGKSKAEAIKYAKEINDKVNFDYSVADEPTIFRALGPISKVFLQFKKYPVKQLELFQDFYLDGRELGLNRKQAALRTLKYMAPYMAMSGMMGIPFISLAGGLLSALVATATGDDDWDWEKKIKQYMITEFGEDSPITQWWLYGAGSFIGLNLGSRVGMGDFLGPDSYNSADGLLGLAVNQTTLGSTIQQVNKQLSYRNYAEALKAINPTIGNIALAYKGEVRTTRGRMKYQYQNMAERMWRAIGFTPLNETLAGDLASNEYAEKQEQTKAKQKAVDDFLANPSSENAARLNELGVTPKSLENESARRTMNRHQLNELAKEKEAAKKKKKPKTYSASDYLKAVQ